jgi:hypothetical protein
MGEHFLKARIETAPAPRGALAKPGLSIRERPATEQEIQMTPSVAIIHRPSARSAQYATGLALTSGAAPRRQLKREQMSAALTVLNLTAWAYTTIAVATSLG